MTINKLIESIFLTETGSKEENNLIEKLAALTGKSVDTIKSAIDQCRSNKFSTNGFKGCMKKKLGLDRPKYT